MQANDHISPYLVGFEYPSGSKIYSGGDQASLLICVELKTGKSLGSDSFADPKSLSMAEMSPSSFTKTFV